jgi:integrase
MVDVTDVQGYQNKFENQQDRLENADIDERDRDAIRRWVVHLRANDTDVDSLGTVVGHLNRIRLASERGHMPLVEFDAVEDVNALKLHLEDVHGLSQGTVRNYMKAVRKFFFWYIDKAKRNWPADITIGASPERKHDPADEITSDELNAMLDAASELEPGAREKAMVALLRDTGLRIGAILSLQMKHVDFEDRRGTIKINEEANVKDASGAKPVTWSRGYVANWLDVHPRPDDPEAALIHKVRDWDEDEHGALRQQYAGQRVRLLADRAGIDDADRIHAHLFRGTAISEWIRDDSLTEQKIKHRVDWSKDSSQFKAYSMVADEEMNDAIFDDYGIEGNDSEEDDTSPELDKCPQCRASLRGPERFCPGCAAPLTQAAVEGAEEVEDDTFESATNADITTEDVVAEFRRRWKNDADFRSDLIGENHA